MAHRNPAIALRLLKEGNQRFVAGQAEMLVRDVSVLRERTYWRQRPVAAVLACADARVPVELIFDQAIGSLFVARIAGNVATREIVGSLEYAVEVLETSLVLVLGHHECGAIRAAMEGKELPGSIGSLLPHLQAAVTGAGNDLDRAAQINATHQAKHLGSSAVLWSLLQEGRVQVVAAFYDMESGAVTWL